MTDAPGQDRLVIRLLNQIESAVAAEAPALEHHPDDEMLALFAQGELHGHDRDELVRHLSECAACRQTAAAVMTWTGGESSEFARRTKPIKLWASRRRMAWAGVAAAASLLLAFATLFRLGSGRPPVAATEAEAYAQAADLLREGRFDTARTVVVDAARRGMESNRLRTIEAQALRQIPATLALAYAGCLTNFGFEIGGATARSATSAGSADKAEAALGILARSDPADDTAALNRGHALLSLGRPREALAEFQRVARRAPENAPARLGEGLASYALADYPAAELAFRSSLQLDANQTSARINLAMTLSEQGKIDQAVSAWNDVLAHSQGLSGDLRRAIQHQIDELQAARQPMQSPAPGPRPKD
jgi:tetratricopeptide (TPR) repeat protein